MSTSIIATGAHAFNVGVIILATWVAISIALLVVGWDRRRPAITVVGIASVVGLVGAIGGLLVGLKIQGTFLGINRVAFGWQMVCAGIGWVVGAGVGFYRTRNDPSASRGEVWILWAAAAFFMLSAIVAARWMFPVLYWELDGERYPDASAILRLRRLIWLDGAIAAAICLGLIVRARVMSRRITAYAVARP